MQGKGSTKDTAYVTKISSKYSRCARTGYMQSQAAQTHIEDLVRNQLEREAQCEKQRQELQTQVTS